MLGQAWPGIKAGMSWLRGAMVVMPRESCSSSGSAGLEVLRVGMRFKADLKPFLSSILRAAA